MKCLPIQLNRCSSSSISAASGLSTQASDRLMKFKTSSSPRLACLKRVVVMKLAHGMTNNLHNFPLSQKTARCVRCLTLSSCGAAGVCATHSDTFAPSLQHAALCYRCAFMQVLKLAYESSDAVTDPKHTSRAYEYAFCLATGTTDDDLELGAQVFMGTKHEHDTAPSTRVFSYVYKQFIFVCCTKACSVSASSFFPEVSRVQETSADLAEHRGYRQHDAYYNAAYCYYQTGQFSRCRQALDRASALNPKSEKLQRFQANLNTRTRSGVSCGCCVFVGCCCCFYTYFSSGVGSFVQAHQSCSYISCNLTRKWDAFVHVVSFDCRRASRIDHCWVNRRRVASVLGVSPGQPKRWTGGLRRVLAICARAPGHAGSFAIARHRLATRCLT
jgi:hypothetical protein